MLHVLEHLLEVFGGIIGQVPVVENFLKEPHQLLFDIGSFALFGFGRFDILAIFGVQTEEEQDGLGFFGEIAVVDSCLEYWPQRFGRRRRPHVLAAFALFVAHRQCGAKPEAQHASYKR